MQEKAWLIYWAVFVQENSQAFSSQLGKSSVADPWFLSGLSVEPMQAAEPRWRVYWVMGTTGPALLIGEKENQWPNPHMAFPFCGDGGWGELGWASLSLAPLSGAGNGAGDQLYWPEHCPLLHPSTHLHSTAQLCLCPGKPCCEMQHFVPVMFPQECHCVPR